MEDRNLPSTSSTPPASIPPVTVVHRPLPNGLTGAKTEQQLHNPFVRLAVVAGILLPIATVPYLVSRRRISGLQRKCEELQFRLNVVQRQLDASFSEVSSVKNEQAKMRTSLHDVMRETHDTQQDAMQRAAEQSQVNQVMQSDLHKLLEETEQIRTQFATLRELGVSLADIAAFMQEVELQMGLQSEDYKDGRGIHRLRLLALQMQNLMQKEGDKNQSA